jgi:hypothetical protein
MSMPTSTAALVTWIITVLGGLILLIIWLMEYDREFQTAAATRLPVPVISAHALLGVGGLLLWVVYLISDDDQLGVVTLADLGVVGVLGLVMAVRWISVYRRYGAPGSAAALEVAVPPERHFPVPVILLHGTFAVVTIALVGWSVLAGS